MHRDGVDEVDLGIPFETLDPAQTIMIKWGGVVPFCWSTWNDTRFAHIESINHLVISFFFMGLNWVNPV